VSIAFYAKEWAALAEVAKRYWPDSDDRVEMYRRVDGNLVVRIFNGTLKPREVVITQDGRVL
jgi:hypothetical protein